MSLQQPAPSFQQLEVRQTEIDGEMGAHFAPRYETRTEWVDSTAVCTLEDWR